MVASRAAPGVPQRAGVLPDRPVVLPVAAFTLGLATLVWLASGRAGGGDLAVVVLGSCLAWPAAAAFLLDRHPGHPLGTVLCVPALVPLAGALTAAPAGTRPLPSDVLTAAELPAALMTAVGLVAVPLVLTRAAGGSRGRADAVPGLLAAGALTAAAVGTAQRWAPAAGQLPDAVHRGIDLVTALGLAVAAAGAHLVLLGTRRGSAEEDRDRLGWALLGAAALGTTSLALAGWAAVGGPPVASYSLAATLALAPAGLVVLVLTPGLPALDRALARATAFAAACTALAAVYLAVVAGLAASGLPQGPAGAAVLTGTAALLAVPLWGRCRAAVEGRLFGSGRRPESVLAGMRRSLDAEHPAGELGAVSAWVAEALGSPAVHVREGSGEDDASGAPLAVTVPLQVAGQHVGRLEVAPRRDGERYGSRDRALLEQLAVPVALVAQVVGTNRALARSEQRVSEERAQERRRVLDDLHDGLGPALAGVGLQLAAARERLTEASVADERAAEGLRLLDGALEAVADARTAMRRLVLDIGSTAEAAPAHVLLTRRVQELVAGWSVAGADVGLTVELAGCDVPDDVPAPVAEAAHRIVAEAVTNVVRHAHASRCTVAVATEDGAGGRDLVVQVRDDGTGASPTGRPAGVGTRSMRHRAEALGGRLVLDHPPGGGTTVLARLPLPVVP